MGVLRDMLADTLMNWALTLVEEPDEQEALAEALIPVFQMRGRRYERDMAEHKAKRAANRRLRAGWKKS